MLIKTLLVTPFQQNCRLLIDRSSNKSVVVDPGGDVPSILDLIDKLKLDVEGIWLTHSHIDHVAGVAELKKYLGEGSKLYGHKKEELMRSRIVDQAKMFGLDSREYQNSPEPDVYIDEGDELFVGALKAKVIFTPGHSPGHVSFYFEPKETLIEWLGYGEDEKSVAPILIAGDTLFRNSIGRTDLPGSVHGDLINSIKSKLFRLSDETVVLSGHGQNTTIGYEKRTNPFLT